MTRAIAEREPGPAVTTEGASVGIRSCQPMKLPPYDGHARPEDVAAVVSFLASEEAGFVSGQVIYVAGGPLN